MKERLVTICLSMADPTEGNALGAAMPYFYTPIDLTIVYVTCAPSKDDAAATIDINDDGSAAIAAISSADADVPGEWATPGYGGTETPVKIAAGSKVSMDVNGGAVATAQYVQIWALTGGAS